MNGGEIALDTNVAISVLNGRSGIESWLAQHIRFFLPSPVVGELRYGAINSQHSSANLARVTGLQHDLSLASDDSHFAAVLNLQTARPPD